MVTDLVAGKRGPRDRIEAHFVAYHLANPNVYTWFDRMAHRALDRGRTVASARHLCSAMVWEVYMSTEDANSVFKINNNYSALYGRLWMELNPEHDGFFHTRGRRARPEDQ